MPSPISIPFSSPALYVPIHRRSPSTGSSYTSSASRTRSPSPSSQSSRRPSPSPPPTPRYVYTPADLLSLSQSPLARTSAGDMDARLRAVAPEVVQTRKQRKALAWHARHPTPTVRRARAHTSESEEDRASSWRSI